MTKQKSTKKTLLTSVLSLVLCVAMLIGTTFAWFTDSVTSSDNKIVSGNLDIDLYLWNSTTESVEITDESDPIFGSKSGLAQDNAADTLWEPGKTQVVYLSLKNNGSLDLKYKVAVDVENPVDGKNLYEVMQYAIKQDAQFGDDVPWGNGLDVVTGINTTAANDVVLGAGDEHFFALSVHMKESAGNEYMNGQVNFDIKVLATQLASEEDSFGKDYDKFADYDGEISNIDSLMGALNAGGTYKLVGDVAVPEGKQLTIPANVSVALDLGDKEISANSTSSVIVNNGNLTIAGSEAAVLKNTAVNGGAVINNKGTLVLDGVSIVGAPMDATGYPAYAVLTSGKLTVEKGTTISTDRGAISMNHGAEVVINGGSMVVSDAADGRNMTLHTIYAYGNNSKLTINDGYFKQGHSSGAGASVICPAGAAIAIYDGDFSYAGPAGTQSGIFQNYMGYGAPVNVYGGTFDDSTVLKNVAEGYVANQNADGTYSVFKGVKVNNTTGLTEAIKTNEETIVLSTGNFEMPDGSDINLKGKSVTIIGTENTVIDVSHISANDQFVTGATVVFDGVTLNFGTSNYMGFANTKSLVYKNCSINGLQFLYGDSISFENCTFNSNGAEHCVWTYGGKNINFTDCNFTYGDRGINCYKDQDIEGGKQVVNFKNCTFTTTNTASKGAVEINSNPFSVGIEVNMTGCTAPAYGEMAYVSEWDSSNGAKTTINIK